ncbi:UNVERIFIED_ORG: hypothetical protein B2H93_16035 [Clostridium botulinum]
MNSEVCDNERVVKLQDYISKKDKIKEFPSNIQLNEQRMEEKTEFLRKMFTEFLESDIMPVIMDGKKEISMDGYENDCIKNNKNVNNIKNNCCDMLKEVELMKIKSSQPIPKAIIVYIILSAIVFGIFSAIFVITLFFKIRILSVESCIVGIISTLGLLATSIVSINDWRKFIKNV